MNKKIFLSTTFALLLFMLMAALCGCGEKSDAAESEEPVLNDVSDAAPETLSDEQALSAIIRYCCTNNPALEDIVNAGEYPTYWEIASSDEQEIVVLFRSYTGAQVRYYIDRSTGDTCVTEYVPGITPEEQRTDESFNIRDYLAG